MTTPLRQLTTKDLLTVAQFTQVWDWGNLILAVDRSAPLVRNTLLDSPLPWLGVWHGRMGMKAKRKNPMVDVTAKMGSEMRKAQKKATKLVIVPEAVLLSHHVRVRGSRIEVQNPETKEWSAFAEPWCTYIEQLADGTRRSRVCRPHEVPADAYWGGHKFWRATTYELNRAKLYLAKYNIQKLEESVRAMGDAMGRNPDKWQELKERKKKTKKTKK